MPCAPFLKKALALGLAFASALVLAACSDTPPVTPSVPTVPSSLNIFPGHIEPLGQQNFFFQLIEGSAMLRIGLTGVTADGQKRTVDSALHIQAGQPTVDGCADALAADTSAGLTANLVGTLPLGTYCVSVKDLLGLTEAVDITIRIVIVPLADAISTATETFSSNLAFQGLSSKSFLVQQSGTVRVSLTSLGAPAGTTVGLALGVQGNDAVGCRVSKLVRGTPGAELTATVDPGFYCAAILDSSTPQTETPFTVTFSHP